MDKLGNRLAVIGSVLHAGPIIGIIGTTISMVRAFSAMGSEGMGDPQLLAQSIGASLITTAIGLIIGCIGLLLILVTTFGRNHKPKWLYWFLLTASFFWLLLFPVGSVIGLALLIYLLSQRKTFIGDPGPPPVPEQLT